MSAPEVHDCFANGVRRSPMKLNTLAVVLLVFATTLFACTAIAQDLQRGFRNYLDIMNGKTKFEQVSPQERQEVLIIYQRMQAQRYRSDKSPECQDSLSRAEDAASELADYSKRLRTCAEAQDFNDDCSSEFRRVRNAHSEYEDAVSSVSSYCR
jgi:hypothetical protein